MVDCIVCSKPITEGNSFVRTGHCPKGQMQVAHQSCVPNHGERSWVMNKARLNAIEQFRKEDAGAS